MYIGVFKNQKTVFWVQAVKTRKGTYPFPRIDDTLYTDWVRML